VLAAAATVEGSRCARAGESVECTGALAEVLTRVYASFASD
jgi:hypothetical protein